MLLFRLGRAVARAVTPRRQYTIKLSNLVYLPSPLQDRPSHRLLPSGVRMLLDNEPKDVVLTLLL